MDSLNSRKWRYVVRSPESHQVRSSPSMTGVDIQCHRDGTADIIVIIDDRNLFETANDEHGSGVSAHARVGLLNCRHSLSEVMPPRLKSRGFHARRDTASRIRDGRCLVPVAPEPSPLGETRDRDAGRNTGYTPSRCSSLAHRVAGSATRYPADESRFPDLSPLSERPSAPFRRRGSVDPDALGLRPQRGRGSKVWAWAWRAVETRT